MLKNKTRAEIEQMREDLFKQKAALDRQLTITHSWLEALNQTEETKRIASIPKDFKKIKKKDWMWILENHHTSGTMVRFNFSTELIRKLGFDTSGFNSQTNQHMLILSKYMTNEKSKNKILHGFKILKKYLTPGVYSGEDYRGKITTEKGILIEVHHWPESTDDRPVLYIHSNNNCTLYTDAYSPPRKFTNFKTFLDFYIEKLSWEEG